MELKEIAHDLGLSDSKGEVMFEKESEEESLMIF